MPWIIEDLNKEERMWNGKVDIVGTAGWICMVHLDSPNISLHPVKE